MAGISSKFGWWLGLVLALSGCREDRAFWADPGSADEWPQAGRRADGRAFARQGPEAPLQLLWQHKLNAAPAGGARWGGGRLLQLTTAPTLYTFEGRSGRLLGKRGADVPACGAPVLMAAVVVFAILGKEPGLRALDRQSGDERWAHPGVVCVPLVAAGDTLLAAAEGGVVLALRGGDGRELWRASLGGRLRVAPALDAAQVYAGNAAGELAAFDRSTGGERWRRQLQGGVRTRPAVGAGRVFVGTGAGEIYALEADSGRVLWQVSLGALPSAGMALAPGALLVGSVDHHVYALDPDSGAEKWRFETGGVVRGGPAASAHSVYCGSSNGFVYMLEAGSGRLLWKYQLNGPALQPVTVGPGAISIATEKKMLYVFGR